MKTYLWLAVSLLALQVVIMPMAPERHQRHQDIMRPGSWYNPLEARPEPFGGFSVAPRYPTGGRLMSPGSYFNPMQIKPDGFGGYTVQPTYPDMED